MRHQYDGLGDLASIEAQVYFDPDEDRARQEFKEDADINVILRKFGVQLADPRKLPFGYVDYSLDFQQAQLLVQDARRHLQQLPADVLSHFGGVPGLVEAIARGERLEYSIEQPPPVSRGGAGDSSPEPQRTAPAAAQEPPGGSKTTP